MSVYVFVGPTLPAVSAAHELDAVFLPPVSQGDVYRISLQNPEAIGIVDGTFRHVPSVWHKEILWALHQGIPVFGSASMGALRAAELWTFGMRGVGKIFEAYRDGALEDDDEVAIAHSGSEQNFVPVSEAMVNIRYTLESAEHEGILSGDSRVILADLIKQAFFASRTYALMVELGQNAGLPAKELQNLSSWLRSGRRDQKREDAIAMLHAMRPESLLAQPRPKVFAFEHTRFFERARRSAGEQFGATATKDSARITLEDLLNELRLDPIVYKETRKAALLRGLALREGQRDSLQATAGELQAAGDEFRRSLDLYEPDATELWMFQNQMNSSQFRSLIREEIILKRVSELHRGEFDVYIRSELRASGRYHALASQLDKKRRVLEFAGLDDPTAIGDTPCDEQLLEWYFSQKLNIPKPGDTAAYSRDLDFADVSAFMAVVQREYWYDQLAGKASGN